MENGCVWKWVIHPCDEIASGLKLSKNNGVFGVVPGRSGIIEILFFCCAKFVCNMLILNNVFEGVKPRLMQSKNGGQVANVEVCCVPEILHSLPCPFCHTKTAPKGISISGTYC